MTGDIGRQQAHYRRGLVLGLTIAESMLLILFALLIALAALLLHRDQVIYQLRVQLPQATQALKFANTKVDVLQAMVEKRPTDEFIREVTEAREQEIDVSRREQVLQKREHDLEEKTQLAQALGGAPDKKREALRLAAIGALAESEIKKRPGESKDAYDVLPTAVAAAEAAREAGYTPQEAKDAFRAAEQTARDTATLKGQVASLRNDLAKVGRGGDWPPCWVTPEGRPEYLFDIDLLGDGNLRVRDTTPPARAVDRTHLSVSPALMNGDISPESFLSLTTALYEYEIAKNCRFYVTVGDRTDSTQKVMFKNLLFTVESRFYKLMKRST